MSTERTAKRAARERLRAMMFDAKRRAALAATVDPHLEEAAPAAVPKGEAEESRACMVRDAPPALLTMRGEAGTEDAPAFLPPSPTKLQQQAADLTAVVRALYEEGVVPVVEIARLAGVAQRTLYRYVERGGWTRRSPQRGPAVAAANRGRPWRRPEGFTQPRGAGGRFLGRDEAGAPQPRGLKALDPAGAAQAAARGEALARLSADALARAEALRLEAYNARTLLELARLARATFERERRLRERERDFWK